MFPTLQPNARAAGTPSTASLNCAVPVAASPTRVVESARPARHWVHLLFVLGMLVAPFDHWIVSGVYAHFDGFLAHEDLFHLIPFVAVQWAIVALVLWAALGCSARVPRRFFLRRAASGRLLACGALGLGLLINVLAKSYWGRPRPKQVLDFGGLRQFQALWEPHFGHAGTSFASGHSGGAALFLALVWLVDDPRRARTLAWCLVPAWIWVALSRIAVGAHYPSDVLLGSWLSLAPLLVLDRWLGPVTSVREPRATTDHG